jgi:hypothetical protein
VRETVQEVISIYSRRPQYQLPLQLWMLACFWFSEITTSICVPHLFSENVSCKPIKTLLRNSDIRIPVYSNSMLVILNNRYRVERSGASVYHFDTEAIQFEQRGGSNTFAGRFTPNKDESRKSYAGPGYNSTITTIDIARRETQTDSIPMNSFVRTPTSRLARVVM